MASDDEMLREALGLGAGVILSADEIEAALAKLPKRDADRIRLDRVKAAAKRKEEPKPSRSFGGVRR